MIIGLGDEPLYTTGYGCLWPTDAACFSSQWDDGDWDNLSTEVRTRAVGLASETLRRLTGYRVGGCPITVRPCSGGCAMNMAAGYYYGQAWSPGINADGHWVNGCGHRDCTCSGVGEVNLPAPVGKIYQVKVNGTVVPSTNYRQIGTRLVWIGTGPPPWSLDQDICLPDTAPNTFSVRYLNSYPVDAIGAYAVAVLAMEYAKACAGSKCRLPSGVTSVTRQGISMTIATGAFPNGLTGIREVDAFIAMWNPNALMRSPQVYNPDVARTRVV